MVRTVATFTDAAAECLRHVAEDRGRKAATIDGYRSIIRVHLLPACGDPAIENVTVVDVRRSQRSWPTAASSRPPYAPLSRSMSQGRRKSDLTRARDGIPNPGGRGAKA